MLIWIVLALAVTTAIFGVASIVRTIRRLLVSISVAGLAAIAATIAFGLGAEQALLAAGCVFLLLFLSLPKSRGAMVEPAYVIAPAPLQSDPPAALSPEQPPPSWRDRVRRRWRRRAREPAQEVDRLNLCLDRLDSDAWEYAGRLAVIRRSFRQLEEFAARRGCDADTQHFVAFALRERVPNYIETCLADAAQPGARRPVLIDRLMDDLEELAAAGERRMHAVCSDTGSAELETLRTYLKQMAAADRPAL